MNYNIIFYLIKGRIVKKLIQELRIGDFIVPHSVILAPMSGITDLPFRKLCVRYGAALVVSEMVASEEFCHKSAESMLRSQVIDLPYNSVQLLGRDPKYMAMAAKLAQDQGAKVIDINMGCPARKVVSGQCGSALMQNLPLAYKIIDAILNVITVPLTLKMRLGQDERNLDSSYNLAQYAQKAGIKLVTVHARTRKQFYKGVADWKKASNIFADLNIVSVINGDIKDKETAIKACEDSGADAVMVGRACYGKPWLIGQLTRSLSKEVTVAIPANMADFVCEHYDLILQHYGNELGIKTARKHLVHYLDNLPEKIDGKKRKELLTSVKPNIVKKLIYEIF